MKEIKQKFKEALTEWDKNGKQGICFMCLTPDRENGGFKFETNQKKED